MKEGLIILNGEEKVFQYEIANTPLTDLHIYIEGVKYRFQFNSGNYEYSMSIVKNYHVDGYLIKNKNVQNCSIKLK